MTSSDINNNNIADHKLFVLSCFALTVTAMTFAIRAGILGQLGIEYGLTNTELGWVNAMAFLGFPVATIVGGALYNAIGARALISLAFFCHVFGLLLTVTAEGFWGLLISTFLIGFANGAVEAGCNPLIAQLYPNNKVTMLNKFHVWFPGGILIGALLSNTMTGMNMSWQIQVSTILLPTFIYGYLLFKGQFPALNKEIDSTASNLKNLFSPLYLFLVLCMTLTATTELGIQQWIEKILGATGAAPMLILAMMTGIMATGRYFAGPIIHKLNPTGVLLGSAILATLGVYMMSQAEGSMVYVAAILFALGCTYFWPTMVGSVAVYTPKTGALGLSILGGAGMFAVSMWNPVIGRWIDEAQTQAERQQVPAAQIELIAGQNVLHNLLVFPLCLIVAFTLLYIFMRKNTVNTLKQH